MILISTVHASFGSPPHHSPLPERKKVIFQQPHMQTLPELKAHSKILAVSMPWGVCLEIFFMYPKNELIQYVL